jgi:hypothetical protein
MLPNLKRRLFNVMAGMSLLLCVTTAILWATGSHPHSHINSLPHRWGWMVAIQRTGYAQLLIETFHFYPTPIVGPLNGSGRAYSPAALAWLTQHGAYSNIEHLGFGIGSMPEDNINANGHVFIDGFSWWINIPSYALIMAFAVLPFMVWIRYRQTQKSAQVAARGLCTSCGYDLRATPDRCPECGAIPVKPD